MNILDVEENVATTLPETARQTDSQTDQHTPHQSEYNTLPTAPTPLVGSQPSGLSSHAQETCSETSSQLSVDPTIDLTIQEPFAEDSASASTDTDIYLKGLWEERPVLPGSLTQSQSSTLTIPQPTHTTKIQQMSRL